ncbi:hypothetical protein BC567DRAFT_224506 [Phyllosticta citribraziliensis]
MVGRSGILSIERNEYDARVPALGLVCGLRGLGSGLFARRSSKAVFCLFLSGFLLWL